MVESAQKINDPDPSGTVIRHRYSMNISNIPTFCLSFTGQNLKKKVRRLS